MKDEICKSAQYSFLSSGVTEEVGDVDLRKGKLLCGAPLLPHGIAGLVFFLFKNVSCRDIILLSSADNYR